MEGKGTKRIPGAGQILQATASAAYSEVPATEGGGTANGKYAAHKDTSGPTE